MSFPIDCPSCAVGDHAGHDPRHGVLPGLIGGSTCSCSGDCQDRAATRVAAFDDLLRLSGQEAEHG